MGKLRTAAMLVHDYLKYRAGQQEKGLQQKYNMVDRKSTRLNSSHMA